MPRPKLKLFAGPYERPKDDNQLAAEIAGFQKAKRPYVLRDKHEKLATKKSRTIYIWTSDLKRGRSPEASGFITPKEMRTQCRRHNWHAVDWTLSTSELARRLETDRTTVARARRRFAPHTVKEKMRR